MPICLSECDDIIYAPRAHGHALCPCKSMCHCCVFRGAEVSFLVLTTVQVLSHICERVKTLHAAHVAHRDLKPGNVLWRPKHYSWTLIDFGCAAEIGTFP